MFSVIQIIVTYLSAMELIWRRIAFNMKGTLLTVKLDLQSRKNLLKCYMWSDALYASDTYMRKIGSKYLDSLEMRCWSRIKKKLSRQIGLRNGEVLRRLEDYLGCSDKKKGK